jgi:hypothetical protein
MNAAIFGGVFDTSTTTVVAVDKFVICILASLAIGLIIAFSYKIKNKSTKNFITTLALIPAMVCVIIMMVNGNVGTGVAVAGAFSLVRFRSMAGSAAEIGSIFLAMGSGLLLGMGYIGFALLFVVIICAAQLLYLQLGVGNTSVAEKTLRITIPEDLDYTGVFDDIFEKYARGVQLLNVKTTDMGSMFRMTYNLKLKDIKKEKEFVDELRCRNGNMEIFLSRQEMSSEL